MKLRLATRRSALALVQSRWVAAQLQAKTPGLEVELVEVVTQGDRIQNVSLSEIGGKGLFVTEVEQLLLDGRAELAVHSMKDVPAEIAKGLVLAAIPEREDPRDVLVTDEGCALDDLEAGSRVGTNSLRRSLQLGRQRNDLEYAMLRGNVDTRLKKLGAGEYRAIVLAAAGLRRLGLFDRPLWPMPVEISVPSVGQGALAIEARGDDKSTVELLAKIDHAETRAAVEAERAFLTALGGDCHTPLAGHARLLDQGKRLVFEGWVGAADGGEQVRHTSDIWLGPKSVLAADALKLANDVAQMLLARGAREMIVQAQQMADAKKRDPRAAPKA